MEGKATDLNTIVSYLCSINGLQKKDLAEKLGINPVSLSRTLAKDNPKPGTLKAYGEVFGLSYEQMNWFLQNASKINTEGWEEVYEQAKSNGWKLNYDEILRKYIEYNPQESEEVSAMIMFKGKYLYASTLKETKDIVQTIETIKDMESKGTETAAKAIEDLLISKYEKK